MRIAITGASGLIGSNLTRDLEGDGHTVHPLVRSRDEVRGNAVYWNVKDGEIDAAALEGVDAVVHLAGAPIGERWTDEHKQAIMDSRAKGTALLSEALASLDQKPSVLVSGSAVGWYGADRGDEVLTETSAPGDDFLARVCRAWEDNTAAAEEAGIRVVHARTGVVIHEDGPLIDKIELPFKAGVGGRVGNGRQYVPWISLDDDLAAIRFLIDGDLSGPVNVTGPDPVTNAVMTKAIGSAMHRPTVLPVPIFAIRALYGEMGVVLATSSQRAVPSVLQEAGFVHRHASIDAALEEALG